MFKKPLNEGLIERFIDQVKRVLGDREKAKKLVISIAKKDKELAELTQNINDDMMDLLDYLRKNRPITKEPI